MWLPKTQEGRVQDFYIWRLIESTVLVTSGSVILRACEQVHLVDLLISGGDVSRKSHGGCLENGLV